MFSWAIWHFKKLQTRFVCIFSTTTFSSDIFLIWESGWSNRFFSLLWPPLPFMPCELPILQSSCPDSRLVEYSSPFSICLAYLHSQFDKPFLEQYFLQPHISMPYFTKSIIFQHVTKNNNKDFISTQANTAHTAQPAHTMLSIWSSHFPPHSGLEA